ncbi:TetR/AcrR family transcriptional regulator [Brevibacillus sp. H7]|jgi:AcrR family transcriptional regulator|uniref:TetR/AcrR family transcriptional regulator n=1 Tax=Brevibacillus sp. H7 TaxID=3349138 RepID=UPI00382A531C
MDKPKGTPSQEGKGDELETRSRILSAARQLMAQKGYKGATTRKISELAGVNEVTIFRHFKNKERILLELLEELTDIRPLLERKKHDEFASVKEMLTDFARSYYELLVERKEILMICMMEADDNPEVIRLFSRISMTAVEVLAEKLEALHRDGKLPKGDFFTAAMMFVSTFFYTFMGKHRVKVEGIDMEYLFTHATEILLRGIEPL